MIALALASLLALVMVVGTAGENWTAPDAERARTNPLAATERDLSRGRSLYRQHCELCHGKEGRGDGPSARLHARNARPPQDLTRPEIQANLTDGEIFWKIATGLREGRKIVMPSFAEEIASVDDRWRVVLYVRAFESKEAP